MFYFDTTTCSQYNNSSVPVSSAGLSATCIFLLALSANLHHEEARLRVAYKHIDGGLKMTVDVTLSAPMLLMGECGFWCCELRGMS